jgi:hypothetical protein
MDDHEDDDDDNDGILDVLEAWSLVVINCLFYTPLWGWAGSLGGALPRELPFFCTEE